MATSALLRNVGPFTASKLPCAAAPCRTRVTKFQCLYQQRVSATGQLGLKAAEPSNLPLAISIALGALGLTAQRAFADEVISQSSQTISPEDIEILAANSPGSGIDQIIVSLLFGVVVLLLVVVTGGVAYMNISQFLDNRQEKEDRDKVGKELTSAGAKSGGGKEGEDDGYDDIVPLKRANRIKKEKGKGFATSEFTSRR